jgi:hypothetical protein
VTIVQYLSLYNKKILTQIFYKIYITINDEVKNEKYQSHSFFIKKEKIENNSTNLPLIINTIYEKLNLSISILNNY